MPCLSRTAVMAGPGIPLLMLTVAGAVSLKEILLPTLASLEKIVGDGEIGRITVVDAEVATSPKLLWTLASFEDRRIVTVLKGAVAKNLQLENLGDWLAYRERDRVREGMATLHGKGVPEGGFKLRVVEMRREGRQSKSTLFATTASLDELTTLDVPTAYLSRWPNQEQHFRDGRNGGGLNRTHGYGGDYVTHVALDTALEKAERSVARAEARVATASSRHEEATQLKKTVENERASHLKEARRAARSAQRESQVAEELLQVQQGVEASEASIEHTAEARARSEAAQENLAVATAAKEAEEQRVRAARQAVASAEKERATATRALEKASAELEKMRTTPRVIFKRDTTRENCATALTAMVLMLIEYVLQEYFRGLRMEWRTFIELFVYLPVTVRISGSHISYDIEANLRDPKRMQQLQQACSEINRRKIKRDRKILTFRIVDPGG